MDELTESLLHGNIGTACLLGVAVGYFAKKILRIGLSLLGGLIVLLFVCEHFGMISIHVDSLNQVAKTTIEGTNNFVHFLTFYLENYKNQGISAIGGFFIGLKLG
jgi:uncharacterized membrane protein (Fun14 family)